MTFWQNLFIGLGKNLIGRATGRWYPDYPPEAYLHGHQIFSQCGEDMLVANILQDLGHEGEWTYVDVGCFDPIQYSNTYFFSVRGGSGLVVDLNENHREAYRQFRPRDQFVRAAVSDSTEPVGIQAIGHPSDTVIFGAAPDSVETMIPVPLGTVLHDHWPKGKRISFLDVDCEGHDLGVLRSNDWESFRPWVVLVEDFQKSFGTKGTDIEQFMKSKGYSRTARIRVASLFTDDRLLAKQ